MSIRITLTQIGSNVSDPLQIWTDASGPFTYFTGATWSQLLAGYVFNPPSGATNYQVRDAGSCGTILSLSQCSGGTLTTTTTTPAGTTTTTTPAPTTTTTTSAAPYAYPLHYWIAGEGSPDTVIYTLTGSTDRDGYTEMYVAGWATDTVMNLNFKATSHLDLSSDLDVYYKINLGSWVQVLNINGFDPAVRVDNFTISGINFTDYDVYLRVKLEKGGVGICDTSIEIQEPTYVSGAGAVPQWATSTWDESIV
jgi:hypothetical protein